MRTNRNKVSSEQRAVSSLRQQLNAACRAWSSLLTAHCSLLTLLLFAHTTTASAQAKRVVILKVDGLQPDIVERVVRERDERTGKSSLPWIEHVFYGRGVRLQNFY